MSEDTQTQVNGEEDTGDAVVLVQDELTSLKARADLMGMKYHPSISVEKLREKIAMAIQSDTKPDTQIDPEQHTNTPAETEEVKPALVASGQIKAVADESTGDVTYMLNETDGQRRQRLRRAASEQIRIRVTCMNPNKKDWPGEIFTVGNTAVGTLKKFVPFNAEDGWYVPRMILQVMQERQCQIFINGKSKNGIKIRESKLIKEFAIEILPNLTEVELKELARRQAMANGQEG